MNREKQLIKNTGILAVGRLSSKLFTFLLLPLYTSLLLPEDYGTIDVLQTIIFLIIYFLTLQIESAVFRFLIDNRMDKEKTRRYISSAVLVLFLNTMLCTAVIAAVNVFYPIPYLTLFLLSLYSLSFSLLAQNIARGFGHTVVYSIGSFLITLSSLIANIVLIIGVKIGAKSILIALAVSNFLGGFFIYFYEKIWQYLSIKDIDKEKIREMINYSLPLVPNSISWWIANASDRILILAFMGTFANGLYAAANKIPTIYTTLFDIFNLAWTESVAIAMKDKDSEIYIDRMLNKSYRFFSFLNLGIVSCMSLMFRALIGVQYDESYAHICILLIAVFFNSICSLYGSVLTGYKDSKAIGYTTVLGAIVNFIVNIALIRVIGLYAASISTLVSYITIMVFRFKACRKYVHITFDKGFGLQLICATGVVTAAYFYRNTLINLIALILLIGWGVVNNKEIITSFLNQVRRKQNELERN